MIAIYSSMFFLKKIHQQLCCPACIDREDKRVKSLQIYREKNKKKRESPQELLSRNNLPQFFWPAMCKDCVYNLFSIQALCNCFLDSLCSEKDCTFPFLLFG
jgi:hypothetical protein